MMFFPIFFWIPRASTCLFTSKYCQRLNELSTVINKLTMPEFFATFEREKHTRMLTTEVNFFLL